MFLSAERWNIKGTMSTNSTVFLRSAIVLQINFHPMFEVNALKLVETIEKIKVSKMYVRNKFFSWYENENFWVFGVKNMRISRTMFFFQLYLVHLVALGWHVFWICHNAYWKSLELIKKYFSSYINCLPYIEIIKILIAAPLICIANLQ